MFAHNFIKLCAVVHELSHPQKNQKKLSDDAENNIIIIIIKDIYIAPFRHAPKALCKKKVKC